MSISKKILDSDWFILFTKSLMELFRICANRNGSVFGNQTKNIDFVDAAGATVTANA